MFKLAMIQMLVRGGDKAANMDHAVELINQAAAGGSSVVLLPEVMDVGWTHPSAREQAEPIPSGQPFQQLCRAAIEHRIYVCAGLTERDGVAVYNAAVLIGPTGELLLRHRKLNELEIGHSSYDQGDRLGVARTELGDFGLMICADGLARDRAITQTLGYMGADVILSPSAWAVPPDHDNVKEPYGATWREAYIPPARDFTMWIAGCSNVGRVVGGAWDGWNCIGCSLLVGPDGAIATQGPYGPIAETIIYADLQPAARPTRGCGWTRRWKT
jgi:predicted amidohydrolase